MNAFSKRIPKALNTENKLKIFRQFTLSLNGLMSTLYYIKYDESIKE